MLDFKEFSLAMLWRAWSWIFHGGEKNKHFDEKWKIDAIESLKFFLVLGSFSKLQVFANLDWYVMLHFFVKTYDIIGGCIWVMWKKNCPQKELKWMYNEWSKLTIQGVSIKKKLMLGGSSSYITLWKLDQFSYICIWADQGINFLNFPKLT